MVRFVGHSALTGGNWGLGPSCLWLHGGLRGSMQSPLGPQPHRMLKNIRHTHTSQNEPFGPLSQLSHPIVSFLSLAFLPKLEIHELMLCFSLAPLSQSTQQMFTEYLWAGHSFPRIKISHGAIFEFRLLPLQFSSPMANTPARSPDAHMDDWQFALHSSPIVESEAEFHSDVPHLLSPVGQTQPTWEKLSRELSGTIPRRSASQEMGLCKKVLNRRGEGRGKITCSPTN